MLTKNFLCRTKKAFYTRFNDSCPSLPTNFPGKNSLWPLISVFMRLWHSHCDVTDSLSSSVKIELSNFTSLRREILWQKVLFCGSSGFPLD